MFSNIPSDITVNSVHGRPTADVTWTEPNVTDNSGIYTVSSSHNPGFAFHIGTTTVTYSVVDASGNAASLEFDVTVIG